MKVLGLTWGLHWIRFYLSVREEDGIVRVEVKFVDMHKNTGCEGDLLAYN